MNRYSGLMRKEFLLASAALLFTACNTTTIVGAPKLTIDIPEEYIEPSLVDIKIEASDETGLTSITIQRDDKDDGVDNFVTLKVITFSPTQKEYKATYTDTIPSSGNYTYKVIAEDTSGNIRTNTQMVKANVPVPLTSLGGTLVEPDGAFAYPMTTKAWTGGAGQVVLETKGATPSEVGRTAVDAAGKFTLDLTKAPTAAQKKPATPLNLLGATPAVSCTGNAASSGPTVGMTVSQLRVAANKSGPAAPFLWFEPTTVGQSKNAKLSLSSLIYVDQAVKFTGSLTCTLGEGKDPITVNMPLHLYKGWNKTTVQTVTNSSGQITSVSWSYDFPADTKDQWVLLPQTIATAP